MAIADLFMSPQTPEDWAQWAFANMAHHRDINRLIFESRGERLDEYVLDPVDREALSAWLYQHWLMHRQFCETLGIAGFDLTDVDWDDPGSLAQWMAQHGNEHFRAGQILNLE